MNNSFKLFLAAGILFLLVNSCGSPVYEYPSKELSKTFEEFYSEKLNDSQLLKVRPGNEEKLNRKTEGKSQVAFLYIHGFTASRAEGEITVDRLADSLNANVYYLRLPGHGEDAEAHARATFSDYLDESETALRMVQLLGEKVVIIGTSMGGLIATYLAAENPELVDGLILCSPFFDYTDKSAVMLRFPGTLKLLEWLDGPYRKWKPNPEWEAKKQPGYENYWLSKHKYSSLQSLEDLRAFAANKEVYEKVSCPVLMLYYYRDEQHQDRAASVEAMLESFKYFSNPKNQKVAIPEGDHVLTSEYVKTDKEAVLNAMLRFRIWE